ncbi:hypothetical protein M8J75_012751 [Diaphorina citri]|nr:hypothetical protein M8J75_012751 [Diaphorina citri]
MSIAEDVNNQVLSPVDSFILEYRSKILEDQKRLEEKRKKISNAPKQSSSGVLGTRNMKPVNSSHEEVNGQPVPTILVTDCSNKENLEKVPGPYFAPAPYPPSPSAI